MDQVEFYWPDRMLKPSIFGFGYIIFVFLPPLCRCNHIVNMSIALCACSYTCIHVGLLYYCHTSVHNFFLLFIVVLYSNIVELGSCNLHSKLHLQFSYSWLLIEMVCMCFEGVHLWTKALFKVTVSSAYEDWWLWSGWLWGRAQRFCWASNVWVLQKFILWR